MNTKMLPRLAAALVLAVALIACGAPAQQISGAYPWLDTLDAGDGAKESGKRLIALPEGLSRVDRKGESTLLIGVHGYESEGYEWVQPLQTLDTDTNDVLFFRWSWTRCPAEAAADLDAAIGKILDADPKITRVVLVGHSLGGLVVAEETYSWKRKTPLEAHVVASPLMGIGADTRCAGAALSARTRPANTSLAQWRTHHELDGAFKDMKIDPQVVELKDSKVTLLPESYAGKRLGHNWSVSWVAATMAGKPTPP